jgi:hypothetical protein
VSDPAPRRRFLWLAAALVVILAAAGGTWWTLRPRPATAAPGIHAGDLRHYLPPVPAGAVARPQQPGLNGTLTLTELAHLVSPNPDAFIARMNRFQFRDAAARVWTDTAGHPVVVILHRFATVSYAGEQGADLENVNPGDGPTAALDLKTQLLDIDEGVIYRELHSGMRSVYGCGHTGDVTYTVTTALDASSPYDPAVTEVTALLRAIDASLR